MKVCLVCKQPITDHTRAVAVWPAGPIPTRKQFQRQEIFAHQGDCSHACEKSHPYWDYMKEKSDV